MSRPVFLFDLDGTLLDTDADLAAAVNAARAALGLPALGVDAVRPHIGWGLGHLLRGALARPLGAAGTAVQPGWELRRADAGWTLHGSGATAQVNGVDYRPGQVLACGDRISIAGETPIVLIRVED